ncbi:hypothetical protein BZG36_05096 [Bifiguratus adelaidae]|uniref:NB-ARC domain-containing protein n=1 Tax=Bifiguratus adelaidae TaxID=1938954 RepID=A0A261XUI2_9FUNG|nr:hypothetical protein BZG36_05096 [Bifiguratus adelaidae]
MSQAHILGNLIYRNSEHSWTLDVGGIDTARREAVDAINNHFELHDVNYVVPFISSTQAGSESQGFKIDRILNPLLQRVTRCTSASHSAFILLGTASYFLDTAASIQEIKIDQKTRLTALAQNRVRAIPIVCDGIELDSDALFERLAGGDCDPLSLRQLLKRLQMPIVILFVSADARDQDRLRLLEERRTIERALRTTQHRDAFRVADLPSCRVRDLSAGIQEHSPTILHFSGHGNTNGLGFEDEDGNLQLVEPSALASILGLAKADLGLEGVVLSACYSEAQTKSVAEAVGNVIAMEDVQYITSPNSGDIIGTRGGQGKSQLALEYCRRSKEVEKYRGIFWINASSATTASREFETIATKINTPPKKALTDTKSKIEFVKETLESWKEKWLMVFDNYDQPYAFTRIKDFMPSGGRGAILFTSRHEDTASLGRSIKHERTEETIAEGKKIVWMLGCLALAIDQAAAYISFPPLPLSLFPDRYEKKTKRMLEHTPEVWDYRDYRKIIGDGEQETSLSVFTTWEMSFEQIGPNDEKRRFSFIGDVECERRTMIRFIICYIHMLQAKHELQGKPWKVVVQRAKEDNSFMTRLLAKLNDPQSKAFQPTVFTEWDQPDRRIPESLNRHLLQPYILWAQGVVRRPTDVVFLTHILLYFATSLPSAIYLYYNFTWLHGLFHWMMQWQFCGPFTLMLHNHIHNNGVLAKK